MPAEQIQSSLQAGSNALEVACIPVPRQSYIARHGIVTLPLLEIRNLQNDFGRGPNVLRAVDGRLALSRCVGNALPGGRERLRQECDRPLIAQKCKNNTRQCRAPAT